MIEERCVFCGEIIPEGRHVCPLCERDVKINCSFELPKIDSLSEVSGTLKRWSSYFSRSHKHRTYDPGFTKLTALFPRIVRRMADVIDSALLDGEQISMIEAHFGKK